MKLKDLLEFHGAGQNGPVGTGLEPKEKVKAQVVQAIVSAMKFGSRNMSKAKPEDAIKEYGKKIDSIVSEWDMEVSLDRLTGWMIKNTTLKAIKKELGTF